MSEAWRWDVRRKDWEVVVEFRDEIVERHTNMTRLGARMAASGLNSTFARGARVVRHGGPLTAPTYEGVGAYAMARPMAETT